MSRKCNTPQHVTGLFTQFSVCAMNSIPITYENLHLLWPRGDGAVRMLMYFWRIVAKGQVPNFTDEFLAKRFYRAPATIARWRARWESKGILLTSVRCRRTFYEVNIEALQEAIKAALETREKEEAERQAKQIERRTSTAQEISQNLRSQWHQAHPQSDHFDPLSPIKSSNSTTSMSNQNSVTEEPKAGLAGDGFHPIELGGAQPSQEWKQENANKPSFKSTHTQLNGAIRDSIDASSDSLRLWMMEAAQRLVLQRGQQWNRNLQKLISSTETPLLIRAVSSLWEQSQKGNIREAPKFLTRAIQRKYSCTKGWRLPDELPPLPSHSHGLSCPPTALTTPSLFPEWLPTWAVGYLKQFEASRQAIERFELVDGGLQVWTDFGVQFLPAR